MTVSKKIEEEKMNLLLMQFDEDYLVEFPEPLSLFSVEEVNDEFGEEYRSLPEAVGDLRNDGFEVDLCDDGVIIW